MIPFSEISNMQSIGKDKKHKTHIFKAEWLGRKVIMTRYNLEKNRINQFSSDLKNSAHLRHPNLVLMMGFILEGKKFGYIISE